MKLNCAQHIARTLFAGLVFVMILATSRGISQNQLQEVAAGSSVDTTIGFHSGFPQSPWDVKRQTARVVGAEPVLFLDDSFILGKRHLTRTLHPFTKHPRPLTFPVADSLLHSLNIGSLVPAADGDGFWAYCLGTYKDKTLYTLFRTRNGKSFTPVTTDQIPSAKIWHDKRPGHFPQHNNVLDFNGLCGADFTAHYTTFFKVPYETENPFRAIFISTKPRPRKTVILQSKDGVRWTSMPDSSSQTMPFEMNQPTYDPFHDRYLCYLRLWDPPNGPATRWRKVGCCEALLTPAGIRWTDKKLVLASDETDGPAADIYYIQVTGSAGASGGILVMYNRPATLEPELSGKSHCELAFSHDGQQWQRIAQRQPMLSTGAGGSWDGGLVGTSGNPVILHDSLYYYYWGRVQTHDEPMPLDVKVATRIAALRVDGFVSLDAGEETGTLVTVPFWPKGKFLYVNADAGHGEIRVEVLQDYYYTEMELDEKGPDQIKGLFRTENCLPLTTDALCHRMQWKNGENFIDSFPSGWNKNVTTIKSKTPFSNRAIALKFQLKNARLYSFWFADEKRPLEQGRIIPAAKDPAASHSIQ